MSKNVTPAHDGGDMKKVQCAINCITRAMRRNHLMLVHMEWAIVGLRRSFDVDRIMNMRACGFSIRKIARTVHMDDKRVSKIISEYGCHKQCGCKKAKA